MVHTHPFITRWIRSIFLSVAAFLLAATVSAPAAATEVFGQNEESNQTVRDLKTFRKLGESAIGRAVEVEATVTFADPVWNFVFVQDGDDAVFVGNANTNGLELGDVVRVIGYGQAGDLHATIHSEKTVRLRSGPVPTPKPVSMAKLQLGGQEDCRYVTLECVVERAVSVKGHTILFCDNNGTKFHVGTLGSSNLEVLWGKIGSKLRITGVLGITLQGGTENLPIASAGRRIKMLRVLCMAQPKVLSSGQYDQLPSSLEIEPELSLDQHAFQLDGQVTYCLKNAFLLAECPSTRKIRFDGLHAVVARDVVRVAGTVEQDSEKNTFLNAIVTEVMFSTSLPPSPEFQAIDPKERIWKNVKVSGRPENVRTDGETIQFNISRDGQVANVQLLEDDSTSVELLRNTRKLAVAGTVLASQANGDCTIGVPSDVRFLSLEPKLPVWKYIAWFLLPLTALFSIGFIWVKRQRNRAAAQAASINAIHSRLVSTFTAISDGLLAVDHDQRVLSVNSEFCKFIHQELAQGDKISAETFGDFLSQVKEADVVEARLMNQASRSQEKIEIEIISPDLQRVTKNFDLAVSPIVDPDSFEEPNGRSTKSKQQKTVGRLLVLSDRTSERQLQAELIHSNKIEAVGQLVGGIAHNFNNILAAVTANLSILASNPELAKPLLERVTAAESAANRGTDVVRQLLTYSGKTQLNPSAHSINETVRELYKFAGATFGARYIFEFDLDEVEPFVQADAGSIEQVILNLYLNARDSMPDGGVISTKTRLEVDSEKPVVHIWITDTGPGVPADIRQQIFDPFFTTKAGNAGTGLGLSTSKRLISEQNGELVLQLPEHSLEEQGGSCFVISLPAIEPPKDFANLHKRPAPRKLDQQQVGVDIKDGGGRTVLVVDDEDDIRLVSSLILEQAGFKVETAISGDVALSMLENQHQSIDMMLLDLSMPGISGLEVLEIVSDIYPQLPVVICSGYLASAAEKTNLKLAKPFSAEELVGIVNEALILAST